MQEMETRLLSLLKSFSYDVHKATASLMYILQGMESVRSLELPRYNQQSPYDRASLACFPKLENMDFGPWMAGADFSLNATLEREGEAEQLAFKGWIEQVYNCIWESQYRNAIRQILVGPNTIPPEIDAIGNLRSIRNDLIHNRGIATKERTGKCKVLMWFKTGDSIILGMRHVLDFLNQMGLMSSLGLSQGGGAHAHWQRLTVNDWTCVINRPTPKLVSVRTDVVKSADDGSTRYMMSVVFENGMFGGGPVDFEVGGLSPTERQDLFNNVEIDGRRNLRFRNGLIMDGQALYRHCIDFHRGKRSKGAGRPGLTFRLRKG